MSIYTILELVLSSIFFFFPLHMVSSIFRQSNNFDNKRRHVVFSPNASKISILSDIFAMFLHIYLLYIIPSTVIFGVFMFNSEEYKNKIKELEVEYTNERREYVENKLNFNDYLDNGYKIIAKLSGLTHFKLSLEGCDDNNTVLYFDGRYRITQEIGHTQFIICK